MSEKSDHERVRVRADQQNCILATIISFLLILLEIVANSTTSRDSAVVAWQEIWLRVFYFFLSYNSSCS